MTNTNNSELDIVSLRCWVEVDLDALAHNFKTLKATLKPGVRTCAVVKGDAYGHGAVPVARTMQACEADMLAVASVAEAIEIRKGGVTTPILNLSLTHPNTAPLLWQYDITQVVQDIDYARTLSDAASAAGQKIKVHVKIDTGMGRIGFRWPESAASFTERDAVVNAILDICRLPGLSVTGMFAHFADPENSDFSRVQLTKFTEAVNAVKSALTVVSPQSLPNFICHTAASIALENYPEAQFDMGRFGITLYGYTSDTTGNRITAATSDTARHLCQTLRPAFTVKARIAAIRDLPVGATVGYGCTYAITRSDMKIAVLTCGYSDAYPRSLANKGHVKLASGMLCPVVGRICMDAMMVDVTDAFTSDTSPKLWDIVTIVGDDLTTEMTLNANTAIHDILTHVTARVPRVYSSSKL